jgi:hypothetical protein
LSLSADDDALAPLKLALRGTYTLRSFIRRRLLSHLSTRARRSVLDSLTVSSSVGDPAPGRAGVGVGGGEGCSALRFFAACAAVVRGMPLCAGAADTFDASSAARGWTLCAGGAATVALCWLRGEIEFRRPISQSTPDFLPP